MISFKVIIIAQGASMRVLRRCIAKLSVSFAGVLQRVMA
jgi:hypothetical protein